MHGSEHPVKTVIAFEDINKYGPQRIDTRIVLSVDELARPEMAGVGGVTLEGVASKGDLPREYVVQGNVAYTADLACSRCVEPFPFASGSSFTVRYRPRPAQFSEDQEIEVAEEELDLEYYTEPIVSLPQLAAEQIHLSLPMKPLCDEACQGLCPHCGVNWSRESCSCSESSHEERFAALQALREQLAKKKEI